MIHVAEIRKGVHVKTISKTKEKLHAESRFQHTLMVNNAWSFVSPDGRSALANDRSAGFIWNHNPQLGVRIPAHAVTRSILT